MTGAQPHPPEPNQAPDLPDRLVKHAVQYAHHQQVDWDELPPMMRHYVETKDQHQNALLLYRMGDFFECFFQDAITVARELELMLTSKEAGKNVGRVPMAGIPQKALDSYCAKLVEKGFAIAICDQVEEASQAQGNLVRREITRIITPGTILEEGMLQARRNNFLAAVVMAKHHWGLAYADISTGEFLTTQSEGLDHLHQELLRLYPAEVLLPTNAPDLVGLLRSDLKSQHLPQGLPEHLCYTLRPQRAFTNTEARQCLLDKFRLRSLEGLGCEQLPLAVRAAGGLLEYLQDTSEGRMAKLRDDLGDHAPIHASAPQQIPLQPPSTYAITEFLILDYQTRRNLEIVQTVRDGSFHGSLLWALDHTITPMGSRMLRRWLLQPLLDRRAIEDRQDSIQELLADGYLREDLQKILRNIYDLERLAGRAGSGTANARDLLALADSLATLTPLAERVNQARSPYLQALQTVPPVLEQLAQTVMEHLVASPPVSVTDGNVIRSGVHQELDQLREQAAGDQQWIANLEALERERTGIAQLKVGYNKTFGYYLSLSRSKADQVPMDYIRKQTLTNEERYITPELKERENRVLNAQAQLNQLEYEIFAGLRSSVGAEAPLIREVAQKIAALDVLACLADLAQFRNYCRPQLRDDRGIHILDGRHPVVETTIPTGFFVPNSTQLGYGLAPETIALQQTGHSSDNWLNSTADSTPDLIILTGPNASGKSCYLRQVGLLQLMAQMGSFIPATQAALGICDRIFTRVGAVDDLATGQSTFMVEMNETANILNHASDRSLVLLDEIGRGTATFDGLSIAWAVAEYLAAELRSCTIFATHYHELNELASLLQNVANFQVTVKELPDEIIFLHRVQPGGADRSYGIEAARLAGLPPSVIQRARDVMTQIERHSKIAVGLRSKSSSSSHNSRKSKSLSLKEDRDPIEQLDMGLF